MKLTVAVVGAGRQGLCAAHDFTKLTGVGRVLIVDRDAERITLAKERLDAFASGAEIVAIEADASNVNDLVRALRGANAVLSSVPYQFGPNVCEAAASIGAHCADLGGNLSVSEKIHQLSKTAQQNHCIVAPDCGLMPGLGNTLAGWAISQLEAGGGSKIDVEIRCGGLPRKPKNALNYELVFSFDGLINEYTGNSVVIRNGEITNDPTLEDITDWMHSKLGQLECATTSGGTSTAAASFLGRAKNYRYKTVRYEGHFQFFRILKNLGLFEPGARDRLRALLEPVLYTLHPDDLVLLRVDASSANGESVSREYIDYRDPATGFTAMERMTAFPAVAVLELALEGRLAPGSIRVETDLPFDDYFSRLERRGIVARH
ncbi:MAG: saccharopine dehydrogenase C-terminal domain-containing protein [Planctomycetota bacterium]